MGLAMAKDGSLLMADDANGTLYRIAYTGPLATGPAGANVATAVATTAATAAATTVPAAAMLGQAAQGFGGPIALERPETAATAPGALSVSSPAFAGNQAMPPRYSDYADDLSPPLAWTPVAAAKSYALLLDDPAAPTAPYLHWSIFNLPPSVTQLPEGLQKQGRLTAPENVLQGKNSRGSLGYTGPRPPVGDPPHPYNFQVFALDTMLNVDPRASRDELLKAMSGHVIAKGRIVGVYQQGQAPMK